MIGFKLKCSFSFQIVFGGKIEIKTCPSPILPTTGPHSRQGRRDSVMTSTKLKDTTKMSRTFQYISCKKIEWKKLIGMMIEPCPGGRNTVRASLKKVAGDWTNLF